MKISTRQISKKITFLFLFIVFSSSFAFSQSKTKLKVTSYSPDDVSMVIRSLNNEQKRYHFGEDYITSGDPVYYSDNFQNQVGGGQHQTNNSIKISYENIDYIQVIHREVKGQWNYEYWIGGDKPTSYCEIIIGWNQHTINPEQTNYMKQVWIIDGDGSAPSVKHYNDIAVNFKWLIWQKTSWIVDIL